MHSAASFSRTICYPSPENNLAGRYSPLFSGVLASSSPLTSIGVGAALLDGGVGVAAAEVGVLPPPDEEVPVLVWLGAVGVPAVGVVTGATAAATTAAAVDAGVELAKLGTNSSAFTFSLENFALTSFESVS